MRTKIDTIKFSWLYTAKLIVIHIHRQLKSDNDSPHNTLQA